MKHKTPLKLSIDIDGYQEDAIVAASIRQSYHWVKESKDPHAVPGDKEAMMKAFKAVYLYYTGRILK